MLGWLKHKTQLQKLEDKYCKLMKNSYQVALKDKDKSDAIHKKANQILHQIKKLQN
ncbi:Lacal_2735 family protein [Aquimarina sp. MMG016]|nr:Lacal_2735 family protein [Aquimarina sp. MMG016]